MISRHVEFVYLALCVSFVRLEEDHAGHVGQ